MEIQLKNARQRDREIERQRDRETSIEKWRDHLADMTNTRIQPKKIKNKNKIKG